MTVALRALAAAAGVASLLLSWAADSLAELDEAITEFLADDRCPDTVPEAWTVQS